MKTKSRFPIRLKKILKWTGILIAAYFVITTIYFGYGNIDERTGICKFYWSGIDDLGSTKKPSGFLINKHYETHLNGVDGPYILGNKAFSVNEKSELVEQGTDSTGVITVKTNLGALPSFTVHLKDHYAISPDHYENASRIIALSDIEGNLTGFYSLLLSNKVIDKEGNWIYGNGNLVLNGDFFDRGSQVTPLLWLIYRLENQAEEKGGRVHFILGNHEIMNLGGNASDNDHKYIEVAKRISGQPDWDKAARFLYSDKSELGKWLRSKNIIEKIGENIFVHGGLNKFHLQQKFGMDEMNAIARKYIGKPVSERVKISSREELILNSINSPYWDRRLNLDWKIKWAYLFSGKDAEKTSPEDLNKILAFYNAGRVIIGHSPVDDISTGYNGKVIKIDVAHGEALNSGSTRALLIENGTYYKVNDLGQKKLLLPSQPGSENGP